MKTIGTTLYLKGGDTKLMIVARGNIIEENKEQIIYDYGACIYPMGLDIENLYYFNEEDIDKVVFEGYKDEGEERFMEMYNNWIEENKDKYKKVKVSDAMNNKDTNN